MTAHQSNEPIDDEPFCLMWTGEGWHRIPCPDTDQRSPAIAAHQSNGPKSYEIAIMDERPLTLAEYADLLDDTQWNVNPRVVAATIRQRLPAHQPPEPAVPRGISRKERQYDVLRARIEMWLDALRHADNKDKTYPYTTVIAALQAYLDSADDTA